MQRIKVSFDTWIQLLGMLGVIGGLVFVGLEMRQTQQIAIAAQVQARAQQLTDQQLVWFQGRWELGHKISTTAYEDLKPEEKWAAELRLSWTKTMQTNNYYMYRNGFLDEEQWAQVRRRIIQGWGDCSIRHTYDFAFLEPSYVELLRSLPDSCDK